MGTLLRVFLLLLLKRELAVDLISIPVESLTSWAVESDSPGFKPSHHGWGVCRVNSFPLATVPNCHKFSGLKQHKLIILQFCRLNIWHRSLWVKIKLLAELHSFPRGLKINPFPGLIKRPYFLAYAPNSPTSKPRTLHLSVPAPTVTFFYLLFPF